MSDLSVCLLTQFLVWGFLSTTAGCLTVSPLWRSHHQTPPTTHTYYLVDGLLTWPCWFHSKSWSMLSPKHYPEVQTTPSTLRLLNPCSKSLFWTQYEWSLQQWSKEERSSQDRHTTELSLCPMASSTAGGWLSPHLKVIWHTYYPHLRLFQQWQNHAPLPILLYSLVCPREGSNMEFKTISSWTPTLTMPCPNFLSIM